jgi:hypothetical protein
MPKGAAAAPVKKLTAAIFMGSLGMGFFVWLKTFVALSDPADKAVAPIYFKNFLRERSFDILPTSFLSDGLGHQGKISSF